jgi:Na+-transporting NADH:ubiquinone oxidoreductase subunit C
MRERILMVVFVLVMGTILTGALVGVNRLTTPAIARNEEIRLKRNVLKALDMVVGESEAEVLAVFERQVEIRTLSGRTFYVSRASGDLAFEYVGSGLWGPIRGAVAVDPVFERIRGVTVFHQEETPGLGSRITERGYLDEFRGKPFRGGLVLASPRGNATSAAQSGAAREDQPAQIDAITGATMTSAAFVRLLTDNLFAAAADYAKGRKP